MERERSADRLERVDVDVHAGRGIGCADCHTMRSLQEGRRTGKTCRDCHPKPSPRVPEHAIVAHLDKMECWACHSAWGSQEYGTFLVRPRTPEQQQAFAPLPQWGEWRKSAYLKRQDAPPQAGIGHSLNARRDGSAGLRLRAASRPSGRFPTIPG